jgi:hypothetical protein
VVVEDTVAVLVPLTLSVVTDAVAPTHSVTVAWVVRLVVER